MENLPKPPRWIIGAIVGGILGILSFFWFALPANLGMFILGPIWYVLRLSIFPQNIGALYFVPFLATPSFAAIGGLLLAEQRRPRIIGMVLLALWFLLGALVLLS